MPDPTSKLIKTKELQKVDTTLADNMKMVLEKHKRQNNQPIQEDRKIFDNKFKKTSVPQKDPINMGTKINPKTAKAMYKAGMEANKEKIAKETYGEFGFDTLTYDQQQEVYKNYPKLPRSSKDIGSDFETPAKMGSALYAKLTAGCKAAARKKFDVYPSAYANMWASKQQKKGKC